MREGGGGREGVSSPSSTLLRYLTMTWPVLWIRTGCGSRREKKLPTKMEKIMLLRRPLWRPRDKKIQIFLNKKRKKLCFSCIFSIFGHQNPGSGSRSGFTWNAGSFFRIRIPDSMNPDPQHWMCPSVNIWPMAYWFVEKYLMTTLPFTVFFFGYFPHVFYSQ